MMNSVRRLTTPRDNRRQRLTHWWDRLQILALKADIQLGTLKEYEEYFDDGDSPEETLECELKCLTQGWSSGA